MRRQDRQVQQILEESPQDRPGVSCRRCSKDDGGSAGPSVARGCADCGYNAHSIALDFDHVRGVKTNEVSYMVKSGWPLATILEEIEKCDVVCANCHRVRTHARKQAGRHHNPKFVA